MEEQIKTTLKKLWLLLTAIDGFWWFLLFIVIAVELTSFIDYKTCLRDYPKKVCDEVRKID